MTLLGIDHSMLTQGAGFNTAREISNQPELWRKVYSQVNGDKERISSFLEGALSEAGRIILTGAGTSAYIGQSLKGTYYRNFGIFTDTIATTDLVSHPRDYLMENETVILVSFARSGNSPESKAAVILADRICKKCFHIIITCDKNGQLALWKTDSPKLMIVMPPEANDQGLAMTASYSCMLLCGFLISRLNQVEGLHSQVETLSRYGEKILNHYAPLLKDVAALGFERVVFLGSGPFLGTANESHLKLQELTDGTIICKHDSFLGFRHGPKAITNESTLLVFIFSNNPYVQQFEKDLILSMQKGRKALFTIAVLESHFDMPPFDLEINLSNEGQQLDEELLTVCFILPAQILAFYKSLQLGLKPDNPSVSGAISRVVEDFTIYKY